MNAQASAVRPPRALLTARGALLVVLLGGLLVSATYPGRQLLGQRGRIQALEEEEREISERIVAARAEVGRLGTDEEVERLAREELGMVRPGEVAFAIAGAGAGPRAAASATRQAPATEPRARQPAEPSGVSRWWGAFTRALGRAF